MIAEHYLKKLKGKIEKLSVAESLQGAKEILEAGPVDLILLDLTLPDSPMDATLSALADLTEAYSGSFVALSSLSTDDIARQAIENGAASFLGKQSIKAAAFEALLDDLAGPAADAETPASTTTAPSSSSPAPSTAGAAIGNEGAAASPGAGDLDPKKLASKLAHDALGWTANIAFRARAMAANPAVEDSEQLQADLENIRASVDAITSFIQGSRTLLIGELARAEGHSDEVDTIELGPWLNSAIERWKKTTRDKRLQIHTEAESSVSLRGGQAGRQLAQVLGAVLQNATLHAGRVEGPITLWIRETAPQGDLAMLEITDDGGPWHLEDPTTLGTALGTGAKRAPSAGLGLYNASRAISAMGGTLTMVERVDAPGAYAIRIALPIQRP